MQLFFQKRNSMRVLQETVINNRINLPNDYLSKLKVFQVNNGNERITGYISSLKI